MRRSSTHAARAGFVRRLAPLAVLVVAGCADAAAPAQPGGKVDTPAPTCASGQVNGPDGACMPVGPQGCAPMFLGEDGLCHPSIARCEPGTIPRFEEGCVAVGIAGCAPELLGDDGLCRPRMSRCPAGTFAVPQEGCVPIDGPEGCGTDTWGAIADAEGTIYVDPSYAGPTGDGTRARPVTTIAEGLALVEPGGTVALAAGTYEEPVIVQETVTLAGRCPSMVRLDGSSSTLRTPTTVTVYRASGVTLRGLQLGGAAVGVGVVEANDLTLDRVLIRNPAGVGVLLGGGVTGVQIAHTLIEGTGPLTAAAATETRFLGSGVSLSPGAEIEMTSVAIVGSAFTGIDANAPNAVATARDSLIEGAPSTAAVRAGTGVLASYGGRVALEDSAVVDTATVGVISMHGGSLTGARVLVEGVQMGADGGLSCGVTAQIEGAVRMESSVILDASGRGVCAHGAGSTVDVDGSLIQGTRPTAAAEGTGFALERASGTLRASTLVRNTTIGVIAVGEGASLVASGILVEDTLDSAEVVSMPKGQGSAVAVSQSAHAELTSSAFVRSRAASLALSDGASVRAEAIVVEGTLPVTTGYYGWGVSLESQSSLELIGGVLANHYDVGAIANDSALTVRGSLVEDTSSRQADGDGGFGVLGTHAQLSLSGSIVRRSRVVGIVAERSSQVDVDNCLVEDIQGGQFTSEETGEAIRDIGDGVLLTTGTVVAMANTQVRRCARAGILATSVSGSLSGVRASENRFGLVLSNAALSIDAACEFKGNTERDLQESGDMLALPDTSVQLP